MIFFFVSTLLSLKGSSGLKELARAGLARKRQERYTYMYTIIKDFTLGDAVLLTDYNHASRDMHMYEIMTNSSG